MNPTSSNEALSPVKRALLALEKMQGKLEAAERRQWDGFPTRRVAAFEEADHRRGLTARLSRAARRILRLPGAKISIAYRAI